MVKFFDDLSTDETLSEAQRNSAKVKEWTCSDNESQTWIGNPARSREVRLFLTGLQKEKRDEGDVSHKSLPLTYKDLCEIQAYYRDGGETILSKYQVELMLYVKLYFNL
jgi:hypothetical protein